METFSRLQEVTPVVPDVLLVAKTLMSLQNVIQQKGSLRRPGEYMVTSMIIAVCNTTRTVIIKFLLGVQSTVIFCNSRMLIWQDADVQNASAQSERIK